MFSSDLSYTVPALPVGTYAFRCVVHPQMVGTIEATEGGGAAAQGPTLEAMGLAFDTATIELAANTATTVTLDNEDAGVPHNIAVFKDSTLADVLFRGTVGGTVNGGPDGFAQLKRSITELFAPLPEIGRAHV